MNHRRLSIWANAAAGLLAALAAFGASAAQAHVYTYQGQAFTKEYIGRGYTTSIDGPGIAFSIILAEPLQAGQTVSLQNLDLFHDNDIFPGQPNAETDTRENTFTGVMGQNGSFESWDFSSVTVYDNLCEHSRSSKTAASDGQSACSFSDWQVYNLNTPGAWTQRVVSLDAALAPRLNSVYRVEWVRPVPEADAGLMAVLGVAAVGALARRKAQAA